mgnify:CR=1 FL=1
MERYEFGAVRDKTETGFGEHKENWGTAQCRRWYDHGFEHRCDERIKMCDLY